MVRAPTPEDEDSRRVCHERKALITERVQYVTGPVSGRANPRISGGFAALKRASVAASDLAWPGGAAVVAQLDNDDGVTRRRFGAREA